MCIHMQIKCNRFLQFCYDSQQMIFFKITVVPIAVCGSGDSECLQLRRGSLYIKSIKGQPLIATIIPLKIEMKLKKQIIKKRNIHIYLG